jgi:hypothetical protein
MNTNRLHESSCLAGNKETRGKAQQLPSAHIYNSRKGRAALKRYEIGLARDYRNKETSNSKPDPPLFKLVVLCLLTNPYRRDINEGQVKG